MFDVHLINYPEHASTGREMEEKAPSFFPTVCLAAREAEAVRTTPEDLP
jgi:hypothetical protein